MIINCKKCGKILGTCYCQFSSGNAQQTDWDALQNQGKHPQGVPSGITKSRELYEAVRNIGFQSLGSKMKEKKQESANLVPHKWAEIIKAAADGEKIQYRHEFPKGQFFDWVECPDFNDINWAATGTYRIKPKVEYPETKMTALELAAPFSSQFAACPVDSLLRELANTVIKRAIKDGQVILPEK